MRTNALRLLLAAILSTATAAALAQLTIKDDLNRPLIVKHAAKRVVTLSPSLTELVYAAGAGDLLVGVDSLSDYPPQAKSVAQVATGAQFSVDVIAKLKPDLVIAWRDGIRRDDIDRMSAFGATVFVAQARSLADIPRLLEVVGRLTGRDTSAAVSEFESRLERVRRANAGKPRMTAFLEIWNRPLTTISGKHFLSEALEICRADNVFRELGGAAPKVTWEQVATEDPYVIVGAGSASNPSEFRANWAIRQSLSAVRAERLVYLDSDAIQRPSPRTPEGIEQLCATLDKVRHAGGSAVLAAPAPAPNRTAAPFAARPGIELPGVTANVPRAPAASPFSSGPAVQPPVAAPAATAPEPAPPLAVDQSKAPRRPSQYGM